MLVASFTYSATHLLELLAQLLRFVVLLRVILIPEKETAVSVASLVLVHDHQPPQEPLLEEVSLRTKSGVRRQHHVEVSQVLHLLLPQRQNRPTKQQAQTRKPSKVGTYKPTHVLQRIARDRYEPGFRGKIEKTKYLSGHREQDTYVPEEEKRA